MADFFLTSESRPLTFYYPFEVLKEVRELASKANPGNAGILKRPSKEEALMDHWLSGFKKALEIIKNDLVESQQKLDDKESLEVIAKLIEKTDSLKKDCDLYAPNLL